MHCDFIPSVQDLNWAIAGVGDFNKDGKPDILWWNKSTGQNYAWYMDGVKHTGGAFTQSAFARSAGPSLEAQPAPFTVSVSLLFSFVSDI
jgi:hypothetical protein